MKRLTYTQSKYLAEKRLWIKAKFYWKINSGLLIPAVHTRNIHTSCVMVDDGNVHLIPKWQVFPAPDSDDLIGFLKRDYPDKYTSLMNDPCITADNLADAVVRTVFDLAKRV